MTIFHIKYPRRRGFLKWDELGCLARALGFQVDLFRDSVTDEISVENDGMFITEMAKMLEYRLLYKALHQTVNMHTAEWNMAAVRKAVTLLAHKALSFEEIHGVRVAYQLYEAGDMKGMNLDKHTLLRSLKMCGRTIAPLKVMHRIKHMKEDFEEVGRIQLSEYFDLILWCDLYHGFNPKEMEYPDGKENKLFKLVDFENLLSHHDERLAWALNRQYLKDEWDFGQETLGTKQMFKEPPITNEARIHQTKLHKRKYRHLKHEVGSSQKRVYRAHAGYIRERPITAPDLSMYHPKATEDKVAGTTAHEAYQSVRRRLKSAPPSARSTSLFVDRPSTQQYQRQSTPKAVTHGDISEVERKMNSLKFDMITLDSKYEIDMEEKMDHFLPGYREKLAKRPPPVPPPEPEPEPPKPVHWTEEVIEQLVHPTMRLPPSHARKCDARYRGWHSVRTKKGPHFVLVASSYENSPQGQMFQKLRQRTFEPVRHIHKDHLFRYTSATQVERGKGRLGEERPVTAPAVMQASRKRYAAHCSSVSSSKNGLCVSPPAITVSRVQEEALEAPGQTEFSDKAGNENMTWTNSGYKYLGEHQNNDLPLTKMNVFESQKEYGEEEVFDNQGLECDEDGLDNVEIPVPPMQHSKPKIVEVGHIGTISLLEKIEESQDLEDRYSRKSHRRSEVHDPGSDSSSKVEEGSNASLSSPPLSVKFNEENQKLCTSTPGPMTQADVSELSPSQTNSTDFVAGDSDSTLSPVTESKSRSAESKARSKSEECETNQEEQELDVESVEEESRPVSAQQVQTVMDSEKERKEDATIGKSRTSAGSSVKTQHHSGSFQRNSSMNMNRKYFRLIQRVSNSVSQDLQIRLLTHGKNQ